MSMEGEISNLEAAANSLLEEMSTTDESMGANLEEQVESMWETQELEAMESCPTTSSILVDTMSCPTTSQKSVITTSNTLLGSKPVTTTTTTSNPMTNPKPVHEKIPLKIPGNVLTTTSVASAAAAAALASAAADAAAAAAALKNNPNAFLLNANRDTNGIIDKPYHCDICDKAFALRRALKAHKRVHTGEKPFKCDTCPKAFSHQGALKAHKRVHTGERPFKCDVCDMSFSHRSTLITHRRTHTGEKPFKCDLCDEVFSYRRTMKSHRKKHVATSAANVGGVPNATGMVVTSTASSTLGIGPAAAKRQLFSCSNCGKECTSKEELDAHVETHSEKNPSYRCFTCNKTFSNCDLLEKHKLTHLITPTTKIGISPSTKILTPTMLTSPTTTNTSLAEKIIGAANKDTNGDVSAPKFPTPKSSPQHAPHLPQQLQQTPLQNQLPQQQPQHNQREQQLPKKKLANNSNNSAALVPNRIHIEERPYKCYICNDGFPTITALTIHEKKHNDDTSMSLLSSSLLSSYTCDVCGVVFSEKSNLDAHKKTHAHEKPFDYKPITVASQKDYTDSPFECTICGALFTNNMWSSSA